MRKGILVLLIGIILLCFNAYISPIERQSIQPAPNYQYLFVHGVSSWDIEWKADGVINMFKELGIPESNLHAYSFTDPEQSAFVNAREFVRKLQIDNNTYSTRLVHNSFYENDIEVILLALLP